MVSQPASAYSSSKGPPQSRFSQSGREGQEHVRNAAPPLQSRHFVRPASTDGTVLSHLLHLRANGEASKGVDVQALQALIPLRARARSEPVAAADGGAGVLPPGKIFPPLKVEVRGGLAIDK